MNIRLTGVFALKSPLSHIGETISTTAYLVEEPIIQPDGGVERVFSYSGNAWRGQLRDLAAAYMLAALGDARVPLDTFHLLFSGGRIGGEQSVDIEAARRMRATVPMLALWGGGVGNQILAGKMRVSNCYPVCREAIPVLTPELRDEALSRDYAEMTFEKSFSRRDDAKIETLRPHLALAQAAPDLLEASMEALPKKSRKDDGPADQMRMTVEMLAAGTRLSTSIDVLDASDVELGALVSALHAFSRSPHIGGQSGKGHGRAGLSYNLMDLDTGEVQPFLSIDDGPALLAPPAEQAKDAYDQHLRRLYDEMLSNQAGDVRAILGAA